MENHVTNYDPTDHTPTIERFHNASYHDVCSIAEFAEDYGPGGFYPVSVGTVIPGKHNHRYRALRKLGYGGFGMVWLAHDEEQHKIVAIKISRAEAFKDSAQEIATYFALEEAIKQNTSVGSRYVVDLIDDFEVKSANGLHRCFIFEPMGPSCGDILLNPHLTKSPHISLTEKRIPLWMAKRMTYAMIQAAASIHKCNYVHGDIRVPNLLLQAKKLKESDATALTQDPKRENKDDITHLKRKDGKPDKWAPEHILRGKPLWEKTDFDQANMLVKMSDLGSAFPSHSPPAIPATSPSSRPPEVVMGERPDEKLDIWCIGLSIYQILTSKPLFTFMPAEEDDDDQDGKRVTVDEALTTFIDVLGGPLPEHLAKKWPRQSCYYDNQGRKIRSNVEEPNAPKPKEHEIYKAPRLEDSFHKHKLHGISPQEAQQILALLRKLLALSSRERPSMTQVLADPWIASLDKA